MIALLTPLLLTHTLILHFYSFIFSSCIILSTWLKHVNVELFCFVLKMSKCQPWAFFFFSVHIPHRLFFFFFKCQNASRKLLFFLCVYTFPLGYVFVFVRRQNASLKLWGFLVLCFFCAHSPLAFFFWKCQNASLQVFFSLFLGGVGHIPHRLFSQMIEHFVEDMFSMSRLYVSWNIAAIVFSPFPLYVMNSFGQSMTVQLQCMFYDMKYKIFVKPYSSCT